MSGISWTDRTWNPIVGCSKVSPGCTHCYAETMARRLRAMGRPEYQDAHDGERWTGQTTVVLGRLFQPFRWSKPQRVFVCSMSDLFHESTPFADIALVWGVMAACPRQTFQVLTKRPSRAVDFFAWLDAEAARGPVRRTVREVLDDIMRAAGAPVGCRTGPWPLPNVWFGFTAENQEQFDRRASHALKVPARVRFVSVEPMLEPVDMSAWMSAPDPGCRWRACCCADIDPSDRPCPPCEAGGGIHLVIAGGESGPRARPMHPDWARSLRDQCRKAGVAFHFKQWGEWSDVGDAHELAEAGRPRRDNERVVNLAGGHGFHGESPRVMRRVGRKFAGRVLDGVIHDDFPEVSR